MSGFSIRLTHKIMAIGLVGLIGLSGVRRDLSGRQLVAGCLAHASPAKAAPSPISTGSSRSRCWRRAAPRRTFSSAATNPMQSVMPNWSAAIERDMDRLKALGAIRRLRRSSSTKVERRCSDGLPTMRRISPALVQAEIKLGLNEKLGLTGSLRARRPRHRNQAQGNRRSPVDQCDADDAPAREGFHAAAGPEVCRRTEEDRRRIRQIAGGALRFSRRVKADITRSWKSIRRIFPPGPPARSEVAGYGAGDVEDVSRLRACDRRSGAERRAAVQGGRRQRSGDAQSVDTGC